ncbi:MAG: YaaR family protein [Treponema sp.]
MAGVDPISQGLFFAATQAASAQSAVLAKKKEKVGETKKSTFSKAIDKANEEQTLLQEGLPLEIAGMTEEEAVIFLKDAADMAGNKLNKSMLPSTYADYRQKVSQFLRFIVKNNFEVLKHEPNGRTRKGKRLNPQFQVTVINKKLDEMAEWLLTDHKDNLQLLAKVDEIKGMLVDLMAR